MAWTSLAPAPHWRVATPPCRRHGVGSATFYKWKARFGGMDMSEARRLKALEDENAKLKRMLADSMLDNVALNALRVTTGDGRAFTARGRGAGRVPRSAA